MLVASKQYNLQKKQIKNLVLTGGGSQLEGIEDVQVIDFNEYTSGAPQNVTQSFEISTTNYSNVVSIPIEFERINNRRNEVNKSKIENNIINSFFPTPYNKLDDMNERRVSLEINQ